MEPRPGTLVLLCYTMALSVALLAGLAVRGAHPIWVTAVADVAATCAVFAFSFALRNSSFYDAYWSVAPLVIGLYWATLADPAVPELRQAVVLALVAAWGARLTFNWARGWSGLDHEDWRYARIREQTGALYWPASFLGIHLFPTLQVFLGCLCLWPALALGVRPVGWLDAVALLVTAGAIGLEALADQQLHRFRRDPARQPGDILDSGVWSLSRHPNYLGEMGFWWGLWLFGLAADTGWWWTVVGPLAMTAMFRFASLPLIEQRMAERRPGWPAHAARIPILPAPSDRLHPGTFLRPCTQCHSWSGFRARRGVPYPCPFLRRAPQVTTRVAFCSFAMILGLALAACGGDPAPPAADPSSARSLPAGPVVGFAGSYGNHAWRGIPYAEPPQGELRWRAPRPLPPWNDPRESLATGASCTQLASVFSGGSREDTGKPSGQEDCLYLDVFAPGFEPDQVPSGDARLPVMFWIHGGGNTIGNAGFYDGGNLAASRDVIVVAINYRLGPFGWFRHASMRGEGTTAADRSGNYGTLDMVRALEWVRENIAGFGGDPGNVTIFGESAGGTNVMSLVLSPRAAGLFHRAIVQSGGLGSSATWEAENFGDDPRAGDLHSSSEILVKMLVEDGTASDRQAARAWLDTRDDPEVESYLRDKTHLEILDAYIQKGDSYSDGMLDVPAVIRDGFVLPRQEMAGRIARGAYNQVPIVFGTNRDEEKLFMAFNPHYVDFRLGVLPVPKDQDRYDAESDARARAWKARSVDAPAEAMQAKQGPSVFAYRWDWDEEPGIPFLADGATTVGAGHGLEIPFVFGHWDLGPESNRLFVPWNSGGRETLAEQMMSYWSNFAYTGAPGSGRDGDLPEWTPWVGGSGDEPRYMVLDTDDDGGLRMESEVWTIEKVVASVLEDSRLEDPKHRCGVLAALTWSDYIDVDQYARAGSGLCRTLALDDYPWDDEGATATAGGG